MKPFNSRLLIEEVQSVEQKVGAIYVPEFTKDKKELPKFLIVKILDIAPNIENQFASLIGKTVVIETGFLEEVKIENKIHKFALINYVVCVID